MPGRLLRILRARKTLLIALLVGCLTYALVPTHHRFPSRLLFAWDIATLSYLVTAFTTLYRTTVDEIRRHAPIYDEGRFTILVMVMIGVTASFVAIVFELAISREGGKIDAVALGLTGATVVLSWVFTHLIFAVHYAHEYYGPHPAGERGGLKFPGGGEPGPFDFIYFSYTVGCANSTADVGVTTPALRRIVLAHSVLSFFYNTAILALTINIAAGLIPG